MKKYQVTKVIKNTRTDGNNYSVLEYLGEFDIEEIEELGRTQYPYLFCSETFLKNDMKYIEKYGSEHWTTQETYAGLQVDIIIREVEE